jgi:hypothetical protein
MYEFLDRPVTGLDHGGRFLVWSMRSWVTAAAEKTCPGNRIAPAFAHWQMLSGLQPFLRMMALFNRYGLAELGFCALRCNHVSEHEAIILSLLCALRERRPAQVQATLVMLVDEDGIGELIEALAQLGNAMQAVGIYPERPGAEPDQ